MNTDQHDDPQGISRRSAIIVVGGAALLLLNPWRASTATDLPASAQRRRSRIDVGRKTHNGRPAEKEANTGSSVITLGIAGTSFKATFAADPPAPHKRLAANSAPSVAAAVRHGTPGGLLANLAAMLFLTGCTGIPGTIEPTGTTVPSPGPLPTSAAPTLQPTETPELACRKLHARERNDVGTMNQIYHGVDPETGVVRSAAVEAGLGYRVIATKLTSGQTTAWLVWETDSTTAGEEVSYALHVAEITSPSNSDGGPAPYGTQALEAARRCVT